MDPISGRSCGLAGEAIAEARPAYHRPGKRIDGRRHSHQEPTIVKREYEPREIPASGSTSGKTATPR